VLLAIPLTIVFPRIAAAYVTANVGALAVIVCKTWNHPVVVGGTLLVGNGEEMAAFRLPVLPR
jgi:hypothetical protein